MCKGERDRGGKEKVGETVRVEEDSEREMVIY